MNITKQLKWATWGSAISLNFYIWGALPDCFGRPLNQEKKKIDVQNIVEDEEHYGKHIVDMCTHLQYQKEDVT
jgi:hypothetical protein